MYTYIHYIYIHYIYYIYINCKCMVKIIQLVFRMLACHFPWFCDKSLIGTAKCKYLRVSTSLDALSCSTRLTRHLGVY